MLTIQFWVQISISEAIYCLFACCCILMSTIGLRVPIVHSAIATANYRGLGGRYLLRFYPFEPRVKSLISFEMGKKLQLKRCLPFTRLVLMLIILQWLHDHPEYKSNPFYVSGISYGGIPVPILTQLISNGKIFSMWLFTLGKFFGCVTI